MGAGFSVSLSTSPASDAQHLHLWLLAFTLPTPRKTGGVWDLVFPPGTHGCEDKHGPASLPLASSEGYVLPYSTELLHGIKPWSSPVVAGLYGCLPFLLSPSHYLSVPCALPSNPHPLSPLLRTGPGFLLFCCSAPPHSQQVILPGM